MDDADVSSALQAGRAPEEVFRMHKGDSRNLRQELEKYFTGEALSASPVDVTITSPPYADMKNYKGEKGTQIGFGDSYADYLEQLRKVFRQVYEVTADTGTLWVVVNTFRRNGRVTRLPSDIADLCENLKGRDSCEECGTPVRQRPESGQLICRDEACGRVHDVVESSWRLQDIVIWDKQRARPYSGKNTFRNVFEYILCFSKTRDPMFDTDSVRIADTNQFKHWWVDWPERYHPRGKVPENIWEMLTPSQGQWGTQDYDHPAPFPPALVERIVRLTTGAGGVVLDPFAGTGTVPIQANLMDRYGIGFDVSAEYVESYDRIQRSLREQWETRRDEGDTLEQRQRELAQIIWGLRQLVYGKHLFKRLRREIPVAAGPDSVIHSMFVRSKDLDPVETDTDGDGVACDIHVVFNDATKEQLTQTETLMRNCRTEDPWSGFNLDVSGYAWRAADLNENKQRVLWGDRQQLFLYHGGRHHAYERLITRDQWVESVTTPDAWRERYATDRYVPIISNISIQIDRDGDVPTVERGLHDEPPEEMELDREYDERALFGTVSTTLTDFE